MRTPSSSNAPIYVQAYGLICYSKFKKQCSRRRSLSLVVEKAVAAVKFHPDGRNVFIMVGEFPPAKAVIDGRNLESAIYNLLLNAC